MSGIGDFVIGVTRIGGGIAPPSRTIVLPYARTSLIHIPRRDLTLSAGDSPRLRFTIVSSDSPVAQAIVLTGGIGGPGLRMFVWALSRGRRWWDYGSGLPASGRAMWVGTGVISDAIGSFDMDIPLGTMAGWPRRCGWAVQLDWDASSRAELLAGGVLHLVRGGMTLEGGGALLTDAGDGVLTDGGEIVGV